MTEAHEIAYARMRTRDNAGQAEQTVGRLLDDGAFVFVGTEPPDPVTGMMWLDESEDSALSNFWLEVSKGNIAGHSTLQKFGRNLDIDTTVETVWSNGGLWEPPTSARTHQITSTSGNDTAAGTGARTVQLYGLDANWALVDDEIITLNGTSNVATTRTYRNIHRMIVRSAGSGGENAGDITATADTDSTVTAHIVASANQTLQATYVVPDGTNLYVRKWYYGLNKSANQDRSVDFAVYVREEGEVWAIKRFVGAITSGSSNALEPFDVANPIPARSAIKVDGVASGTNTDCYAGFDGILVEDGF